MKKIILLLLVSLGIVAGSAQTNTRDSLKQLLQNEKTDTGRVLLLAKLGGSYLFEKPEDGLSYAQQGLDLSRSTRYRRGEAFCLNILGALYRMTGNYTTGIQHHLNAMQVSEKLNDQAGIASSYFGIATNYEDQGDYKEALLYYYKAKSMSEGLFNQKDLGGPLSNMGLCFLQLGQLDSALKYEQNAYELQMNTPLKALVLARLGSIHSAMGNYDVALSFYHTAIPAAVANSDNNALNEIFFGMSKLFQKQEQYDSCIYYAKKALFTAQEIGDPGTVIDACSILSSIYKKDHATDSAFKYLELSTVTKDTLVTQDKLKQQQVLAFEEKSRQQEIANETLIANERRKENIQYAAIAIGLITFLVVFLLLSRSIIVKTKFIEFFSVLGLLAVFEFINLFIHPYLAHVTNDSPVLMLAVLIGIGALLVPLHHRLEEWTTKIMVEKNKKIRLAAAKKTIEKLEGKGNS